MQTRLLPTLQRCRTTIEELVDVIGPLDPRDTSHQDAVVARGPSRRGYLRL
jgi:hypothetical protein